MKRILKEIRDLEKDPDDFFLFNYDETNIRRLEVLIHGREDTPYSGAYFYFIFDLPEGYPLSPPIVTYKTTDESIRMNPNLYSCGKVCLSIINTWGSNDWSPAHTIKSIIVSINTFILNEYPYRNEPGFETTTDKKTLNYYNNKIRMISIEYGIIKTLQNKWKMSQALYDKMIVHYTIHKKHDIMDIYDKALQKFLAQVNDKPMSGFGVGKSINYNIESLKQELELVEKSLSGIA
jgi:ubiquitin-protein ligase